MIEYVEGINDCIEEIKRLKSNISSNSPRMWRAMRVFADAGYEAWKGKLDEAEPRDDNENGTILDKPKIVGNSILINFHGKNALFVEFGTGVKHNYPTKYGQQYGFFPGSWSSGPDGKGWLTGVKRRVYKGRWLLPSHVTPERYLNDRQSLFYRKMYITENGEVHRYKYYRSNPANWAEGHKPINGMYHAMQKLVTKDAKARFVAEVFKKK